MIKIDSVRVFNMEGAFRGLRNPMNSWDKSDSIFGIGEFDQYCDDRHNAIETYIQNAFGDKYKEFLEKDPDGEKYQEMYDMLYEWYGENATLDWDEHANAYFLLGYNDKLLAQRMVLAGADEGKFARQIFVSLDITAPLYWWKEFDTYKVATVANSCSTMHKIHAKEFTQEDFSQEHLFDWDDQEDNMIPGADGVLLSSEEILNAYIIPILNASRDAYLETKDKKYWWQIIQLLPSSYNQKRTVTLNYQNLRNMYFARRNHKLDEWHEFCRMIEGLPYAADLICCEKEKK